MKSAKSRRIRRRGDEVGIFVAAASAPRSFQPSLMKRSTTDQGIVTGVSMALVFLIGALVQDGVDTATDAVVNARIDSERITAQQADERRVLYSAVASLSVLGLGLVGKKMLAPRPDESSLRAATRTGSYWLSITGLSGLLVSGVESTANALDTRAKRVRTRSRVDDRSLWPYIIPLGVLVSLGNEYIRSRESGRDKMDGDIKPLRAIGIGALVATVLTSVALVEKYVASAVDTFMDKHRPEVRALRIPTGHIIGFGALTFGLYKALQYVMHKAENNGVGFEVGYALPPSTNLVSGGDESLVSWESLSLQGRRFIGSILTKDDINRVMRCKDALDPIRVFVGLESGQTEEDRVELAIAELRRTGAFDRQRIVVIQPTGTGYINYIMAESVEYLSHGDCALVGMQYSLRPSPLSLDRVKIGIAQHRMLLNAIRRELSTRPAAKRPKIVLFGESLGAWTSQDAFMHQGTDGFEALGVDRALWIGTPAESTWHTEIFGAHKRIDTDYDLVGQFSNFDQVRDMDKQSRSVMRFVMLTNDNDPIAKFGQKILIQEPDWLKPDVPRPATIPAHIRWRSPGTFVHLMIDMKNALKPTPGVFVSDGHDYRASLPAFVNYTYRLGASDENLLVIQEAMQQNEIARSEREAL